MKNRIIFDLNCCQRKYLNESSKSTRTLSMTSGETYLMKNDRMSPTKLTKKLQSMSQTTSRLEAMQCRFVGLLRQFS